MTNIYKQAVSEPGPDLEFVLSDATVDSYGDTVDPNGWDLKRFKLNPIALFGHDHECPIGTWDMVRVEGGKLKGRLNFAQEGTSERIDELRRLVSQRILRAVSVGFRALDAEPKDPRDPWGPITYKKQELLECSLCSVPANPAALSVARSLNISNDTLRLAFGEHAANGPGVARRGISGVPAATNSSHRQSQMATKTLSQRVEDAQNDLVREKDILTAHIDEDEADPIVTEELSARIEAKEASLAALKRAEAALAAKTASPNAGVAAPAVSTKGRQKDIGGLDLVVRGIVARGAAHFGNKPIDQVLEERYPGHEATSIIAKADQTIGTTTVSGWASEIVQTAYADFVQALMGYSIYPVLRSKGIALSFDGRGTVSIPSRTAGGAAGGFVAEGSPIRVGRITTAATTMTSKKLGVIVAFSRELAKKSTPQIESLVRQAILEDTAAALDPILLDATASSSARPAGLLYGVSAAATGYGGGDYVAVQKDFQALLASFITANAADNITVMMNPTQGLGLAMMPGPVGNPGWFDAIRQRVTIVESTNATAGRLIAIRNSDFVTAQGDMPEFDISEQATIHLEDTTPLELVSAGGTVADPTRSLWQTGSIGVRMMMDMGWTMRRSGMVSWVDGVTW